MEPLKGFDALEDSIMIVEDTPESLRLLAEILSEAGFRVRPATSCEVALKSIGAGLPALIILDVQMPGMDGYEFCRRLKADASTAPIPVIFCSALGSDEDRMKGFESGGVDYINKPFNSAEVLARVKVHLSLRRALKELAASNANLEIRLMERTAELAEQNEKLMREISERKLAEAVRRRSERIAMARSKIIQCSLYLSWQDIVQLVVDECEAITESAIGYFVLVEKDQRELVLQTCSTRTMNEFCRAEGKGLHYSIDKAGVWVDSVHMRRPVIYNDYASLTHKKGMPEGHTPVTRFISVPVSRGEEIVAVVGVGNREREYDEHDVDTVAVLSDLCWDIVDRKRAHENLKLALQRTMAHIGNSPLAVVEFDDQFRISLWSKRAEEMFQWRADEVLGKRIGDFRWVYDDDAELVRAESSGIASGERRSSVNFNRNCRKDGSVIHCEWYNSGIYDIDGRIISTLSLVLDVTERKLSEEQREAVAAELLAAKETAEAATRIKSQFLANMSHEIRTPINGIKGFAELLAMSPLDGDQRTQVDYISRSCANLLRIINDILDYSKMESGKFEIRESEFDLPKALETSCVIFRNEARARGIKFETAFGPDIPRSVTGDSVRVRQIIDNLLSNAVKFTEKGSVFFSVDTNSNNDGAVTIRFRVADSGIGIPKERLGELFKPFTQLDMSMRKRYHGTGLGLSIVRKLVEQMGGTVGVDSHEGAGSVFTAEVPFRITVARPEDGDREGPAGGLVPSRSPMRILLAEDDEMSGELVMTVARKLGHTIEQVEDGDAALEKALAGGYDLALLDVQLPNRSGIEIARAVREKEAGGTSRLPMIAVTAYAMRHELDMIMDAGMDDCVIKPVDVATLASAIERHACGRTPARE